MTTELSPPDCGGAGAEGGSVVYSAMHSNEARGQQRALGLVSGVRCTGILEEQSELREILPYVPELGLVAGETGCLLGEAFGRCSW